MYLINFLNTIQEVTMSAPYGNYKIFINRIIQLHYHIKKKH